MGVSSLLRWVASASKSSYVAIHRTVMRCRHLFSEPGTKLWLPARQCLSASAGAAIEGYTVCASIRTVVFSRL